MSIFPTAPIELASVGVSISGAAFNGRALPAAVSAALWRADQLGSPVASTVSSGFETLDAVLPGGGWPGDGLTEILSDQSGALEWRLLGPLLRRVCEAGRSVVLVGPPQPPHPPGLCLAGLSERQLVWVQAEAPAERLWATEQLIKARTCGALITWLPQARPEQVRRLQVLAAGGEGPVFLCRPASAAQTSSAAPLRVFARLGPDWALLVELLKRKEPSLAHTLHLHSVPAGLQAVLTPRLSQPSALRLGESVHGTFPVSVIETDHALDSTAAAARQRHRQPAH